jgi:hypothetical protein
MVEIRLHKSNGRWTSPPEEGEGGLLAGWGGGTSRLASRASGLSVGASRDGSIMAQTAGAR